MTLVTIGQKPRAEGLLGLMLECHERIRTFVKLASIVGERRDLPGAEVVDACQRVERYFTEALPLHVADEEQSLIPRLQGKRADVDAALASMHSQHGEHVPFLAALLEACREVRATPDDQPRRDRLKSVAAQVSEEFERHLKIEETVIFPAMKELLSTEQETRVVEELRARRTRP